MKTPAIFAVFFLASASVAMAQAANPPPTPPGTSVLAGYAPLSVTASSGRVALPSTCPGACALTVSNYGAKDAFFALGGSSVTATTSSTPVRAGKAVTLWVAANAYLAAICGGSDSTTLDLYQGNGPVIP